MSAALPDQCVPPVDSAFDSPIVTKVGIGTGVKVFKLIKFTPNGRHHSSPWAVKKVTCKSRIQTVVRQRLQKEVEVLRTLDHPNIIKTKLVNGVERTDNAVNLEYGGICLASLLQNASEGVTEKLYNISAPQYQTIISDVIEALRYLHEEKLILHGDIKSDNVLFDFSKGVAKLCDFGVSLQMKKVRCGNCLEREDLTEEYVGSRIYRPKEVNLFYEYIEDVPVTDKCDIWAFGLLLYELMTSSPPYIEYIQSSVMDYEDKSFDSLLDELIGTQPVLPANIRYSTVATLDLFFKCTQEEYSERPSVEEVRNLWCSYSGEAKLPFS